ncbi:nucleolar GTP-binding protein [Nematocida sp. LUAm3]|nr:nucleolar GTP-binding protein [Nematocida sp. LUAm3]KAI5176268.1 nucleolar GTP-binding protein [Nematocida sp. LUAm2]KAI5176726.1 nucleolar GTP-binding protein [Nematocida sp. LUAm1]
MNIKSIGAVPTADVLIDTCLSKTNRRTPTEVHRHYKIGRIREFYVRKIKYTSMMYGTKLNEILGAFPKVDEIHPFTSDLINVLYDRDHYKMALGHVKSVSSSVARTEKEYTKMVKYGDSLYRCKQLKRAALGKMSTMAKKLNKTLLYLEEVRQSLMRMPDIEPTQRTLLICGYPNVGKSSFMNSVSRAKVDIQPYAFTTRNLYVGHFDYKYLRWQIIDTPGVLDHPIEEMNTIEMQSVTALAHLRAAILYFIDLSETCGYSIQSQISLFKSLSPLFEGKPVIFILSKSDIKRKDELPEDTKTLIDQLILSHPYIELSSLKEINVDLAKNTACDYLLEHRVEVKLQEEKLEEFRKMLEIRQPQVDPEFKRVLQTEEFGVRSATQKQMEQAAIERGELFKTDLNTTYFVKEEWKYDVIPEIYNGKNISDYIDPEIEAKLLKLEEEEEYYLQEVYGRDYALLDASERKKKQKIMDHKVISRLKGRSKERASVPPRMKLSAMCKKIESSERIPQEKEEKELSPEQRRFEAAKELAHSQERRVVQLSTTQKRQIADKNKYIREKVFKGRKDEADRVQLTERPKHLFSGKRKGNKAQRR